MHRPLPKVQAWPKERDRRWRDGREGEEVQTLNCQTTELIYSQAPWVPVFKLLLSCRSFHHMSYCFLSCPLVSTKKGKKHIAFICNKNIRKENSKSQGQQCVKGRRWGLVTFSPSFTKQMHLMGFRQLMKEAQRSWTLSLGPPPRYHRLCTLACVESKHGILGTQLCRDGGNTQKWLSS